jgi:amino-acid N-acetyltransferase
MPLTAISHARPGDLDEVKALLETAGLAAEGIPDRLVGFIVAREDGRLVGVAGLAPARRRGHGGQTREDGRLVGVAGMEDHETAGLLRSVAVASDQRNRGLGAALVSRLIRRSRRSGHEAVYLLTRTAEEYFARFGFRRVERSEARPSVAGARQFASQVCECSAVMVLELGTAVGGPDVQAPELAPNADAQEG